MRTVIKISMGGTIVLITISILLYIFNTPEHSDTLETTFNQQPSDATRQNVRAPEQNDTPIHNVTDVVQHAVPNVHTASNTTDIVNTTKGTGISYQTKETRDTQHTTTKTMDTQTSTRERTVLIPEEHTIYFGAFPDFGGPEDEVTQKKIRDFEHLIGQKIAWAYFSQNWFRDITYPREAIHTIHSLGITPFVRLMPRSDEAQYHTEGKFTMRNIIRGDFDEEITRWANDAKRDGIPILIDFAVEMNGDWFSWSGYFNGGGTTDAYGDPTYPDGPEVYRDAYRHIIDLFRREGVDTITWFFHPDIYSSPNEPWNQPRYYYPGDEYIDWIGVSVYGPLHPKEAYWETFSEILKKRREAILSITDKKPIALLEFGVTDNHPLGKKAQWLRDAFETILSGKYITFQAVSYWHETWEEEGGVWATLRVDSSKNSLIVFRAYATHPKFSHTLQFTTHTQ